MNGQSPSTPPPPADAATPSDVTQIRQGEQLLQTFLQADSFHRASIDRTLRQHLSAGVGVETWERVLSALNLYLGEELATFILVSLMRSNDADFVQLLRQTVGPDTWSYLSGLIALYADDLREAYAIFGENPQGWRTINRRVFYDYLTDSWHTTFEIIRFNGERVTLDETPQSAIVLCQAILDALNAVPPELAPKVADPEAVENLLNLFYAFIERYAPQVLSSEEGEDSESTPAATTP